MSEPLAPKAKPPAAERDLTGEPVVLVGKTLSAPLADEPDVAHVDAPAVLTGVITFDVPCPDCDWCGGQVAVLDLAGESRRVGYDPEHADVVVGRDVEQAGFLGLDPRPGFVCVGAPPHPACSAINLAHQAGFAAVEIRAAPPGLREHLQPFLDRAAEHVSVTFT